MSDCAFNFWIESRCRFSNGIRHDFRNINRCTRFHVERICAYMIVSLEHLLPDRSCRFEKIPTGGKKSTWINRERILIHGGTWNWAKLKMVVAASCENRLVALLDGFNVTTWILFAKEVCRDAAEPSFSVISSSKKSTTKRWRLRNIDTSPFHMHI